jgi:hypothetical protein
VEDRRAAAEGAAAELKRIAAERAEDRRRREEETAAERVRLAEAAAAEERRGLAEREAKRAQVGWYKSTRTGAAAGTKVQILTQLLVQKYKY